MHDDVAVSIDPGPGSPRVPEPVPSVRGLPLRVLSDVLVAPFNDAGAAAALIDRYRDELAAVIVEPVLGGGGSLVIPPEPGFLERLADHARRHGILLILDEVVTLRLARGGGQELYGVRPDLTTLGKMIGGGLPIGALGGRADLMARLDPRRAGYVSQSGTFSGGSPAMAAGLATLDLLDGEAIARLSALGNRLRVGLARALDRAGIPGRVTGAGSLAHIHFAAHPVRDYRSAASGDREVHRWLHLALLNRGIFIDGRGSLSLSTPMTEAEIVIVLHAFGEAIAELRPLLARGAAGSGAAVPAAIGR
jgi:glutamate-1-semialdehyde 2,1-aminomutase